MLVGSFGYSQQKVRYGLRGGLNVTKLLSIDQPAALGYHVGGFAKIPVGSFVSLQPEVTFSTKGMRTSTLGLEDANYRFRYLDVPLLLSVNVGSVVDVQFGGYASYLLHVDTSSGMTNLDKRDFTTLDFGIVAGLGIDVGNLQIGARYNFGLVQAAETNRAIAQLGHAKWGNAQLYVAVIF